MALFIGLSIVRFGSPGWRDVWAFVGIDPFVAAAGYGLALVTALWLQGLYRLRTRLSIRREVIDVLVAILFLAVVVFTTLYLLKLPNVSRLFLILLFSFQAVLTLVSRASIRALFVRLRSRGYNARYMLVVGANPAAEEFADAVEGHTELGLRPIGYLAAPHDPASGPGRGLSAGPRDRGGDPGRPARDRRRRGGDLPQPRGLVAGRADHPPVRGRGPGRPHPRHRDDPDHPGRPARGLPRDADPVAGLRARPDPRDRHQAPHRHRHRRRRADPAQPVAARRGGHHLAPGRPADPVPPGAGRSPRAAVPRRQVQDDGPRRRGAADRPRGVQRDPGPRLQDDRRSRDSAARAAGCAGRASTSCRSCGTCCAAR